MFIQGDGNLDLLGPCMRDAKQVRYPEDGSVLTAQELLDEWGREFLAEKRRRTDLNRFGLFTTGTEPLLRMICIS